MVEKLTDGEIKLAPGTMYGSLSKMEKDGLIEFVKEEANRILEEGFSIEKVKAFDGECIKRNLSPGGSADLLAITAMLHMILE